MCVETTLQRIEAARIVAIMRGAFGAVDRLFASALIEAGVTALEVTLDSPDAFMRIGRLAREVGDSLAIGAGTVRTPDEVARAADVGASFVLSPHRDIAVITAARKQGLVTIPGCFTPSEIVEALDAGAQAVKLFPAAVLTPAFLHAVGAPLGTIRVVPTGGITLQAIGGWCDAGAWAFGIGSELIGRPSPGAAFDERVAAAHVGARARAFVEAVRGKAPGSRCPTLSRS